MVSPDDQVRLIPRWFVVTVLALITLGALAFLGLSFVFDGLLGWSVRAGFVATGLLLVSAWSALIGPRRRRAPSVTPDGALTFRAPAATVWPLVGAWVALLAVAAMWGYVALTDFSALESPGASLVTIGGALASLPDLVRLLTGRLHRWTLELGPDALSYRGYRTDLTVPWSKVHGARIQRRGPAGVLIDVKGSGEDPVVPITAFAVPASSWSRRSSAPRPPPAADPAHASARVSASTVCGSSRSSP